MNNRVGEEKYNINNKKMKIIEYNNSHDIIVEFDNGAKTKTSISNFNSGKVSYKKEYDRIGEISYNKYGSKMTIIEYKGTHNVIVKFDNGYITKTSYDNFINKAIINPYDKSVYGIGYLGEGKYNSGTSKNHTLEYRCWVSMLARCYDTITQEKQPSYIGCSVCDEWLNFQNFAQWYNENYYKIDNERMEIDKDILVKGNKIYSPYTYCIVPSRINLLFTKKENLEKDLPIGIVKYKNNRYRVLCNTLEKRKDLGIHDTIEESFIIYKEFKENYIKQVADYYKGKIPQKLYDAMYNWEVEIDDK